MALSVRKQITFVVALAAGAALFAAAAPAQMMAHPGTAADAKAMLDKTVAAIKADKAKTLDQINKGENGFLAGDIYPFCFNLSDGINVALGNTNPAARGVVGKDVRTLKDSTGADFGAQLYAAAKEGQVNQVSYMFPKPGTDKTPVAKVSFVTAVSGLGCGVGYYK
jgi:signal transduction histidine kinase